MATGVGRAGTEDGFGQVSRLRGLLFEYLSLGASVFGIVALAVLLVYVFVDAFDLANASPGWLLTYFLVLVLPFVGFCLYSADDPRLSRRVGTVLVGGLVVVVVGFAAVEAFLLSIPRLNWQLAYLFVVVAPTVAYAAFAGFRGPAGRVGFGFLGRLAGGAAIGVAVAILFHVLDTRLWFLLYTLSVVPAGAVYAYGRANPGSRLRLLALPTAAVGIAAAVVIRNAVSVYPTRGLIFLWTIAAPLALATGGLVAARGGGRRAAVAAGGATLAAAVAGLPVGAVGPPAGSAVVVFGATTAAVSVYGHRVLDSDEGTVGLVLPLLLAGGIVAGSLLVEAFGFPAPDPWLDPGFLTSSPSSTPEDAGLYPAIVGSVIIIAMVAVLSFALGVGTAVFLEEYTAGSGIVGTVTRVVQINIANLAAVPSVVYGLLGLGLFANFLGLGFGTAVTAALTLSLLILPITIISAQEAIRAVPDELRQGSYAMGATRWQTTRNVVLPEALPGILTGVILALGRAIGETAPLIMIGAAAVVFNPPSGIWSVFSAMPMQIFSWSALPQEEFRYGALAAGVVTLLIVLLTMNATAIVLRNRSEQET